MEDLPASKIEEITNEVVGEDFDNIDNIDSDNIIKVWDKINDKEGGYREHPYGDKTNNQTEVLDKSPVRPGPNIIIDPNLKGVGICTFGFGRDDNCTIAAADPSLITDLLLSKGILMKNTEVYDSWIENPWRFLRLN